MSMRERIVLNALVVAAGVLSGCGSADFEPSQAGSVDQSVRGERDSAVRQAAVPAKTAGLNVPKAQCGPHDRVESGLQGQTTLAERESGLSALGFNCNLDLVGQFQGEGSKSWHLAWFDDCAYYGTNNNPLQQHRGTVVVDASDPRNPQASAYLDTPTMLDPHETLKQDERRKLLMAGQFNGPGFAIYDLSADCRHPVLKSSIELAGSIGHAGNITPDGQTYYLGQMFRGLGGHMHVVDVADPSNPKHLLDWTFTGDGRPHDLSLSKDGTRLYSAQPGQFGNVGSSIGPNGLVILDVSDIQFRRPNPQIQVISRFFWEDGGQAQQTLTFTIHGRPHLIVTDEAGAGGVGGRPGACARGVPPHGFARIIDISDERNPHLVSRLMLEVHDPANCPVILSDPSTPGNALSYSAHYCNVDKDNNPKLLACTYQESGLRVFDIRDPFQPREIAYYKPPARRMQFLPGSRLWAPGVDRKVEHTASRVRFRKHKGDMHLWFAGADNAFQIVRFTKPMHELLGKDKGDDDDD
jgi:hypothetical protein